MDFLSDTVICGVLERRFALGEVPGVLFSPSQGSRHAGPLVLLAHGGGQHAAHPAVLSRARRYAGSYGFTVAALDAPGHGGRPRSPQLTTSIDAMPADMAGGAPAAAVARLNAEIAAEAVPEWRAVLDGLKPDGHHPASVGFVGFSLARHSGTPDRERAADRRRRPRSGGPARAGYRRRPHHRACAAGRAVGRRAGRPGRRAGAVHGDRLEREAPARQPRRSRARAGLRARERRTLPRPPPRRPRGGHGPARHRVRLPRSRRPRPSAPRHRAAPRWSSSAGTTRSCWKQQATRSRCGNPPTAPCSPHRAAASSPGNQGPGPTCLPGSPEPTGGSLATPPQQPSRPTSSSVRSNASAPSTTCGTSSPDRAAQAARPLYGTAE